MMGQKKQFTWSGPLPTTQWASGMDLMVRCHCTSNGRPHCLKCSEREGDGERERERQTDGETHRDTDRDRNRERERERESERET